ncbi:Hsp70 chaperone, partial [Coemansia aciculifera]
MRSAILLIAVFSCLLALCNATYVQVWNSLGAKVYEVFDTQCYTVDPMFASPLNNHHNNVYKHDIDANGILNVSAHKSTGKTNNIIITNDRGRLTRDDIEQIMSDVEKYKAEDEAVAVRVQAKNSLESYAYQLKDSLDDSK